MKTVAFVLLAACLSFFTTSPAARAGELEVLSVSWQPGYCAARPKSRGCADFSAASPAARQFTLHSRFQPRSSYCGVEAGLKQQASKGKWTDLPEVTLTSALRARLTAAMPAARLGLDRRQWLKSGRCLSPSAEAYYGRSLDLLDALNASPLPALFRQKAGGILTLPEVRAAFDKAFGAGTGERVRLTCRKAGEKAVVVGLTIGLAGGEGGLDRLIKGAPATQSRCAGGITAG